MKCGIKSFDVQPSKMKLFLVEVMIVNFNNQQKNYFTWSGFDHTGKSNQSCNIWTLNIFFIRLSCRSIWKTPLVFYDPPCPYARTKLFLIRVRSGRLAVLFDLDTVAFFWYWETVFRLVRFSCLEKMIRLTFMMCNVHQG